MSARRNPFLEGNDAPVRRELDAPQLTVLDAPQLTVLGELPNDLDGLCFRNGPNPRFEPRGPYHGFDGDGARGSTLRSSGRRAGYTPGMSTPCPICRVAVSARRPENPDFPFCSLRCKTIDLGRWLGGAYALPVHDDAPSELDLAAAERREDA